MIVIFTHRRATEADRVIRQLRVDGADPLRVNTGIDEAVVTIRIDDSGTYAHALCDGRIINPSDVLAAWLHQPPPLNPLASPAVGDVAAESSRMRMWEAFFGLIPCNRWITPPVQLAAAGSKAVQYRHAVELGVPIPATLISNEPESVRSGAAELPLTKYLGDTNQLWRVGDQGYAALTVEVALDDVDDETIVRSPAIHQARVRSHLEIRAVAIAAQSPTVGSVFAASATKPAGLTDIRIAPDGIARYAPCDLPSNVRSQLFRLLETLGVGYCSADFILTPEGQYVFLDLNATGAWWWIDDLYRGAVTMAIADALRSRAQSAVTM